MKTLPILILLGTCASHAAVIVSENFGGLATNPLDGTSADIFLATGGTASSTWIADSAFKADGSVATTGTDARAYLDLGTYISSTKGTAAGLFTFQATFTQPTGSSTGDWITFGTFRSVPATGTTFVDSGLFTSILRASDDTNNNDYFYGLGTGGGENIGNFSGTTTFTMILDVRSTTTNGTVTFAHNGSGVEKTYTYGGTYGFQYVGFTMSSNTSSTISNFTVTQVPEPAAPILGALGSLALLRRRR